MKISEVIKKALDDRGTSKMWLSKALPMSYSTLTHKFSNDTFTAYDLINISKIN